MNWETIKVVGVLVVSGLILWALIKALLGGEDSITPSTVFIPSADEEWEKEELDLFTKVNDYREENGVSRLEMDDRHYRAAIHRNLDNITDGIISHDGFSEIALNMAAQGVKSGSENLAMAYRYPSGAFNSWKRSEGHNNAMLNPNYKWTGVAIDINEKTGDRFYCQVFGG